MLLPPTRIARVALIAALVALLGLSGCGGDEPDRAGQEITTEQRPFSAYRDGQRLKRCIGRDALRVGGFDLRVAGRVTCRSGASLVKGFAPHAGETVQRLHGFTCYSRPQSRVGLLVVCIDDDRVFRFNMG
jgi:hypothetical protein